MLFKLGYMDWGNCHHETKKHIFYYDNEPYNVQTCLCHKYWQAATSELEPEVFSKNDLQILIKNGICKNCLKKLMKTMED